MDAKFAEFEEMLVKKYGLVAKEVAKEAAPKSPPKKKASEMTPEEKEASHKHNIALWTGKLEKSTDPEEEKKLQDKIDAENKKLAKLAAGGAAEKKPKGEKPAAEKKKAEPKGKGENRINKITPAVTSHITKAAEAVGVAYNDGNKKDINKEVINYINGLTDDEFKAKGLKDHIMDFVTTKKATTVADEEDADEDTDDEAPKLEVPPSNAAGGEPENLPVAEKLTLKELQKLALTATVPGKPGMFMNSASGKFVTGPEADEDEDSTEVKFNGKEYAVGDKTGRVYECREEGDFFAGFVGVGQFKEMKV